MTLLNSEIREFNWLTRYLVTITDLQNMQLWLQTFAAIQGQAVGAQGVIISGLDVSYDLGAFGTKFYCEAGFGIDKTGKPLLNAAQIEITSSASYANNVKGYVLLKFVGTGATPTTTSVESGNLHTTYGCELELVLGTPAASPSYPSLAAKSGLILAAFTLNSSAQLTDLTFAYSSFPRTGPQSSKLFSRSLTNTSTILKGTQQTIYDLALEDNLSVEGLLITGNLTTTGYTLESTGGKVVSLY